MPSQRSRDQFPPSQTSPQLDENWSPHLAASDATTNPLPQLNAPRWLAMSAHGTLVHRVPP
jgi:hypothetical protein